VKRILISCLFVWFLIIQAYRFESTSMLSITFDNQYTCDRARTKLMVNEAPGYDKYKVYYTCVNGES
jgi:hypothetical protein